MLPAEATTSTGGSDGRRPRTAYASSSLNVAVSRNAPRSGQYPLKAIQRFGRPSWAQSSSLWNTAVRAAVGNVLVTGSQSR